MSTPAKPLSLNKTPRIVLILQADKACWFKLVEDTVVDSFQEYILGDCVDRAVHCPWLNAVDRSKPLLVELILDTTLDEVDRVGVEPGKNAWVNCYRTFMTLARLRRDYRCANVCRLPGNEHGKVAVLMHLTVPEQWTSWLLMLQEAGVVFHCVATGSELAASWSRNLQGEHLLVMGVADFERHLLVRDGVVKFLRTVIMDSSNDTSMSAVVTSVGSAIDQSLEYVSAVIAQDINAITVLKPRFSIASADEQMSVLLAMLLGVKSEYDNREGCVGAARWSITRSALRSVDMFEPSINHVNATQRVTSAYRVSISFAVIATIAASSALFNGVASKRTMLQNTIQKASIDNTEADITTTIKAAFSRPQFAADSLFIADELSRSVLLDTDELLEDIATVVTAVAGIQLDHLVWTVAERDEPYESVLHSLDSVPARMSIVTEKRNVALQLELSGSAYGETLNEQQRLLDDFVAELWRVQGAVDARVLESPIDAALSSDVNTDSVGRFRVSFILGER